MLQQLAYELRMMQLYYHDCHHRTTGLSFYANHAQFESFYNEVEGDFDSVMEETLRIMGLNKFTLRTQLQMIFDLLKDYDLENPDLMLMYHQALKMELSVTCLIETLRKNTELGTETLLGDVARRSGVRMYKIQSILNYSTEQA